MMRFVLLDGLLKINYQNPSINIKPLMIKAIMPMIVISKNKSVISELSVIRNS